MVYQDTTLANLTQKINRKLMKKLLPTMTLEWQYNHQTGFGYYVRTLSLPGNDQAIWGPYRHDQLIALGLYCGAIRKHPGPQPLYRIIAGQRIIEPKTLGLPHDLKFPYKTHVLQDAQDAIRNSLGPTQGETVAPSNNDIDPIFPFEQHNPVTVPVTEIDLSQVPADELSEPSTGEGV